jgi:hypothetical protein
MKPHRYLVTALIFSLATFTLANGADTKATPADAKATGVAKPAPAAAAGTAPKPQMSKYPWYDGHALPTPAELKILADARAAADKDPNVIRWTRMYIASWTATNELIRVRMLENPASKPFERMIMASQLIHETSWSEDFKDNNPDILLPNASTDAMSSVVGLMVHKSSNNILAKNPRPVYPPTTQEGIRQKALADKKVQDNLQAVRDAYMRMEIIARAIMQKNADVKAVMEKYNFLLYGRRDLGFIQCTYDMS